jgi:hypothetical protein
MAANALPAIVLRGSQTLAPQSLTEKAASIFRRFMTN